MLERLDLPHGIEGVKAIGKVSKEDYEKVLAPMLDEARAQGRRIKFLYQFGSEFEAFSPSGAWEDVKSSFRSMRLLDACAVVSDVTWIREFSRIFAFMVPCPLRVFPNQEREQAVEWLRTFPEDASIAHRLLEDAGVVVVEVKHALRAQDFDGLARTVDPWIEAHGGLNGVVIHAREFPGWENFGSFLRHVRFVRDHHRKVKKIALAADSKFATLAPRLAEHFVNAEVKRFGYDAIDDAVAWAKSPSGPTAASSARSQPAEKHA